MTGAHDGDIQTRLIDILRQAAGMLAAAGLPAATVTEMERLAEQVRQPCRVAVVGEVKAGKSSFLNVLLGQDLAKVGATETTATINYFLYGRPNPDKPIVCVWSDDRRTEETVAFLDSLQGHDLATLRRADGIVRLEYHLLNPYLERVTLIDTPGTGAVVPEHSARTAGFLNPRDQLQSELEERHSRETRELGRDADAVIYLVGTVARANDRTVLEKFQQSMGGQTRAYNTIGVLAKIDLESEVMERRHELTARIAEQLSDSLNTVVPVSAGIQRALDRLQADDGAGLGRLMSLFRTMSPESMRKALAFEDVDLDPDLDCALSADEREALLGDLEWTVFTTVARVAADLELDDAAAVTHRLEDLAGFGRLRELLERHFFRRGQYLRGYRILADARALLNRVKFGEVYEFQQRGREQEARRTRLLRFIHSAGGDPGVARELEEIVAASVGSTVDLEPVIRELEYLFRAITSELEEYNADFEAVLQLEEHGDVFSAAELEELRSLFGLYGMDIERRLPAGQVTVEYVEERQQEWSEGARVDRHAVRRLVADRAMTRYGHILDEMLSTIVE